MEWQVTVGTTGMRGLAGIYFVAMLVLPFPPAWAQSCDYFNYTLDPRQVVPAAHGQGYGWSELTLCNDDSLRGYIGLSIGDSVTAIHIHGPAEPGENGGILYELSAPVYQDLLVLLGAVPQVQREWFGLEKCYVDVHTWSQPEGAIRGQIHHEVEVTGETWTTVKCLYR